MALRTTTPNSGQKTPVQQDAKLTSPFDQFKRRVAIYLCHLPLLLDEMIKEGQFKGTNSLRTRLIVIGGQLPVFLLENTVQECLQYHPEPDSNKGDLRKEVIDKLNPSDSKQPNPCKSLLDDVVNGLFENIFYKQILEDVNPKLQKGKDVNIKKYATLYHVWKVFGMTEHIYYEDVDQQLTMLWNRYSNQNYDNLDQLVATSVETIPAYFFPMIICKQAISFLLDLPLSQPEVTTLVHLAQRLQAAGFHELIDERLNKSPFQIHGTRVQDNYQQQPAQSVPQAPRSLPAYREPAEGNAEKKKAPEQQQRAGQASPALMQQRLQQPSPSRAPTPKMGNGDQAKQQDQPGATLANGAVSTPRGKPTGNPDNGTPRGATVPTQGKPPLTLDKAPPSNGTVASPQTPSFPIGFGHPLIGRGSQNQRKPPLTGLPLHVPGMVLNQNGQGPTTKPNPAPTVRDTGSNPAQPRQATPGFSQPQRATFSEVQGATGGVPASFHKMTGMTRSS